MATVHKIRLSLSLGSLLFLITLVSLIGSSEGRYEPNWRSLDSRPLPDWYDKSKIGIFIHWGVFSVPSYASEWFWFYWRNNKFGVPEFMQANYKPDWTYADFAADFTAEFFTPDHWADIFSASGAKYVVLTSKHHEGFTNWPSKYSWTWNSMSLGPKRDLVGSLADSIRRKTDLHFGLYHSLFEWYNPVFLQDKANNWKTNDFVTTKTMPELYELVNTYKPDIVWSDGDMDAKDVYWNSTGFLAWLYNDSPVRETVVTNDRWGNGIMCHHGGFFTCQDRYNPGKLQKKKWENAMTIDKKSWGYRRNVSLSDFLTIEDLIHNMVETVSCGGNILINVGPTKDGRIAPIFEERLRQMGSWLQVNGEAIYETVPWTHQNDTMTTGVWYTSKKNVTAGVKNVYALTLFWPDQETLVLGAPTATNSTKVTLLGYQGDIRWQAGQGGNRIVIKVPIIPFKKMPCDWAWVYKMENLL